MSWATITHADLARFRVLYAAVMLLMLPSFTWLGGYPDALYRPPPGPFRLLDGFPPTAVLAALGLSIAVALGCLLVGAYVRAASWVATLAMLTGFGFSYSLGKVDHDMLVVLTPVVLLAAGWSPGATVRPWVMRLWAFTVGVAMLTAGVSKLAGGWLDPTTHAVQGYTFRQVYSYDLTDWLGSALTHVSSPWFWEPMDWSAVAVECGLVVLALVGLPSFRAGIALLALFHLGVMLTMDITFAGSLVVYAAFVPWGRLRLRPVRVSPAVGVGLGLITWALVEQFGNAAGLVGPVLLFVGAAMSCWYYATRARIRKMLVLLSNVRAGALAGSAPVVTPVANDRVLIAPAEDAPSAWDAIPPHVRQVPPAVSGRAASQ